MATTTAIIAMTAAAAGTSYVAARMAAKQKKGPMEDFPVPTVSRGVHLQRVVGRRRVVPVFAWWGNRISRKESSQDNQRIWRENGWQLLSVGTGHTIHRIWQNGVVIWDTPITRAEFPSGSEISMPNREGHMTIYWGERHQPINYFLGEVGGGVNPLRVGVNSSWPHICYVVWRDKQLGTQPVWPTLEYDLEARLTGTSLTESASWLDESEEDQGDSGVNAAHLMWELLTAPHPHGIGMSTDLLDAMAFERLGEVIESEHLPLNVLIEGGTELADLFADIMSDLGFILPQAFTKLLPLAVREIDPGDALTLNDNIRTGTDPSIEQLHSGELPNRYVFECMDVKNDWNNVPVVIDDDAAARASQRPREIRQTLKHVTDRFTAYKVGRRRIIEELAGQSYSFTAGRDARLLVPGQAVFLPGIGQLRVAGVKPDFDTSNVEIEAFADAFALQAGQFLPDHVGDRFGEEDREAAPDLHVFAYEAPDGYPTGGQSPVLLVARIRDNSSVLGAEIWISANEDAYLPIGRQNVYAAGGTLNRPLLDDEGYEGVIDEGPTITAFNADIEDVLDLSGNDPAWESGIQIAVIGDEWFFLKRVTAVSGGWRLEGLIRARFGSSAVEHAVNSRVVIFTVNDLELFTHPLIQGGATIWVKSQPFSQHRIVGLEEIVAETVNFSP